MRANIPDGRHANKGRPPLHSKCMRRVTVHLTDGQIRAAARIGDGNVSRGMRTVLLHWLLKKSRGVE